MEKFDKACQVMRRERDLSCCAANAVLLCPSPSSFDDVAKGTTDSEKVYFKMHELTLSYTTLVQNSYPLDTPEDPFMVLKTEYFRPEDGSSDKKLCIRCGKFFDVTKTGVQVVDRPCQYHLAKTIPGNRIFHSCCGRHPGCQIRPYHIDLRYLAPKVRFKKTGFVPSNARSVFALDTEMCVTENGSEATKVSVVDCEGTVVYHTLVKPEKPILDYLTQYSGVTEEDLAGVTTTLEDVQAKLLAMFDCNTIVVGHGLQNDLKALRIIHTTVVDTSVLFPDPKGHPFKKSLKSLVSHYLNYEIQPEGNGHNSVEDARACMELALHYLKSNAKHMPFGGSWYPLSSPKKKELDLVECHKSPTYALSVEGPPAFYSPMYYIPYPIFPSIFHYSFCVQYSISYPIFPYIP